MTRANNRKATRIYLSVLLVFVVAMAAWTMYQQEQLNASSISLWPLFICLIAPFCIFVGVVIFGMYRSADHDAQTANLILTNEHITQAFLPVSRSVAIHNIEKVRVNHDQRGEVISITVHAKNEPPVFITGYTHMKEIATRILDSTPTTTHVETHHINTNKQMIFIAGTILGIVALMWLWTSVPIIGTASQLILFVLFAYLFATKHPLSQFNPNHRRLEILFSISFVIMTAMALIFLVR
jgi:cytochrome bd-type quinol oxidase subunit 2